MKKKVQTNFREREKEEKIALIFKSVLTTGGRRGARFPVHFSSCSHAFVGQLYMFEASRNWREKRDDKESNASKVKKETNKKSPRTKSSTR